MALDKSVFPTVSLTTFIEEEAVRTFSWITVILATLVPVIFMYVKRKRRNDLIQKLPGSKGNSFLIAAVIVSTIMRNKISSVNVTSFQALCGFVQIFSKERILRFWFGFRPVVVFYKPETIEVVLSSNTLLNKSFIYDFLRSWFKAGLITSTGMKWKRRRKLLTPAFHFRILEDFLPVINEHSTVLVQKLKRQSALGSFDMVPFITLCSLDILCETAMGKYIGAQLNNDSPYLEALRQASEMFSSRFIRPWLWPDMIFYRTTEGKLYEKNIMEMGTFTRNVIRERKQELIRQKNEDGAEMKKHRRAFLDLLIHNHIADGSLTEEDIREEVDTFMFAGHDTTAVGMSWTLYCIGLYPEVQNKIEEELSSIFGDDCERVITSEDIREMKYLDCVMKESQRLYPSLPLIGREIQEDIVINGMTVPEGTACMLCTFMLHRNEEVFQNPEVFDPDRFLPENANGRHPYAYIPFSAGPRNCIGQKFAIMEQKVVLANVIRNFRVESLEERDKIRLVAEMVLRSENGIKMKITPREKILN